MHRSSTQPSGESGRRSIAVGWQLVVWAALAIYFLLPPREAMTWGLDSSNYGSYAWMFASGRQFGADTVAMTGPFGFLAYGHTYSGYAFSAYVIGDLIFKAAFAFLVVRLFTRFPAGIWRWLWFISLLAFIPSVDDLIYDIAILTAAIALLVRREGKATLLVSAMLLGFSVLMKGSHATMAGTALGFVLLDGIIQGKGRQACLIVSVAVATFLVGWLVSGQHFQHLPGYFHALFALTSGYNAVMGMDPIPAMLAIGLIAALCFSVALLVNLSTTPLNAARVLLLLFYAFVGFLQWKHGFVRADGHVYMFFGFLTVAVPLFQMTVWRVDPPANHQRKILFGAAASGCAFLAAAAGTSSLSFPRFGQLLVDIPGKFERDVRFLASPKVSKARLDQALEHQKQLAELTDIKRDVGDRSIDFFGYEEGIVLLNGLNYRPRPMGGGSFNVYHPYLQTLNAQTLATPVGRPDFFLFKLQTIDRRFPAADDPLTLQKLLASYQPIRARRDYVLFEKNATSTVAATAPKPHTRRSLQLEEWIDVPPIGDGLLLFSLELRDSFGGALRKLIYHPHSLLLEVETTESPTPQPFAVSPLSVRVPVLLSPLLAETSDAISLYGDPSAWKNVRRIRLRAPDGGFVRSGEISFYSLPKPESSPEAAEEIATYLRNPRANRTPLAVTTQETGITEVYGEPITLVHASGSITYPVEKNDQRLFFSFGIMPQAYDPGETDGVEFIVEYLPADQKPTLLFSRLLQPRTAAKDRGMQTARVFFPPNIEPGVVRIRTERGPAGNGAWDQSYVAHVQIQKGAFDPRQVRGFSVAPAAPGFSEMPSIVVDGQEARSVPPPGELKFPIPLGSRFVTVGLGILPAAYEGENHSDGIGYEIVAISGDAHEEPLQKGNLNPAQDWRARGTVTLDLALPKTVEGGQLALRINGGPQQDLRWDWSYVQTVRFR